MGGYANSLLINNAMRYREFNKQINETSIADVISFVMKLGATIMVKIHAGLAKLKFGSTLEVKLINSKPHSINEAKKVNQAKFGYMAEYGTCAEITKILYESGLTVRYQQGNGQSAVGNEAVLLAEKFNQEYAQSILDENPTADDEVDRQIRAGAEMAKAIVNDAIIAAEDLYLLSFEIIHTGESMKKETAADAILRVTKKDSKTALAEIKASLKSYKTWNVNLNNSTIMSLFNNLQIKLSKDEQAYLKSGQNIRSTLKNIYTKATKDIASGKEYTAIKPGIEKEVTSLFGPGVVDGPVAWLFSEESILAGDSLVPPATRAKAEVQAAWSVIAPTYLDKYAAILQKGYNKNKVKANKVMLGMLGLDGADDFYIAVVNARSADQEFTVRSSRTSKAYAKLVQQFSTDLTVKFEHSSENTASLKISYYSGKELIQATSISIGKSGSFGQAKNNWFFNFNSLK